MSILPQTGPMVGNYVALNGTTFDGTDHQQPTSLEYDGPEQIRRLSGAPFLQGPCVVTLKWATCVLDTFQAIYTVWNLAINPVGGRVTLTWFDPRQAGRLVSQDFRMDEPTYKVENLYVRDVSVVLTEVIE